MIDVRLTTPDALETLSAVQLQAGNAVKLAANYLRCNEHATAKMHAQRGERLNKLATYLQAEILAKMPRDHADPP